MSLSVNADAARVDLPQLNPGPESVITFSEGLVGQPHWKRFVLLTAESDGSVGVLQSVDDERLSLLVTDPKHLLPEYVVVVSPMDWAALGLEDDEQPLVLTTLSIYGQEITTNLVGPLVINPRTREAKQIVMAEGPYSTQHPVARLSSEESEAC
jgi:flagellar assembly factor FliW